MDVCGGTNQNDEDGLIRAAVLLLAAHNAKGKMRKTVTPDAVTGSKLTAENEVGFVNEAALRVKVPVSRRTLFEWRQSGKIPSVKIGARVLFHYPSVERALLAMQRGGAQ